MISAKRKLELAIRDNYLNHPQYASDRLRSTLQLVSKDHQEQRLPRIAIIVTSIQTTEGFEGTNAGEYTASLSIQIDSSADDMTGDQSDLLVEEVECMMANKPEFIQSMNTGENDSRPVKDIRVYDVLLEGMQTDVDERGHFVVFEFSIPFRSDDGVHGTS